MSWSNFIPRPRVIELTGPNAAGGADCGLTATRFKGMEGLSCDFEFIINGVSTVPLQADQWLGKSAVVKISPDGLKSRTFHGMVSQFTAGDYTQNTAGTFLREQQYQLILKPWFTILKLKRDCCTFQQKSVPEIVEQLCHEADLYHLDFSHIKVSSYPKLEYCVQYNETTYDFLSRLLVEAGLYYTYQHSDTQHTLTVYPLGDSNTLPTDCLYHKTDGWNALVEAYPLATHLISWRGGMTVGKTLQTHGETTEISLTPNNRLNVHSDPLRNTSSPKDFEPYLVTAILHDVSDTPNYSIHTSEQPLAYRNRFIATPGSQFAPQPWPKPGMGGPQSAIVTGHKGKAIDTNKQGSVKVKFHWDRYNKADQTSSKWIPVTQLVSGVGWGTQFIPRVGDEVIVDFIDDDPNQPIIIGSAYNAISPLPFPQQHGEHIQNGYQTYLIGEHNEALDPPQPGHTFMFDDTPGSEKISLNSAGTITIHVNNDLTQTMTGDETINAGTGIFIQAQEGSARITAKNIIFNAGASSMAMDQAGIHFKPAGKLWLKAKGVPAEFGVVRINDTNNCPTLDVLIPHGSQTVTQGSPDFQIDGGLAVARVDDPLSCTGDNKITQGASNILLDGKQLAFSQSETSHDGTFTSFSKTVLIAPRQPVNISVPLPGAHDLLKEDMKSSIQNMHLSEKGREFLKSYELLSLTAYPDQGGNCTIGYGHLIRKGPCTNSDKPITESEANAIFDTDVINIGENPVKKCGITVALTQNQFDALVCFAYNNGKLPADMVAAINDEDVEETCSIIQEYHYTHSHLLKKSTLINSSGLAHRRKAEINIYKYGDYKK